MKNTKISILSHASPAIWATRVAGQCLLALAVTVLALPAVQAQETVCASVKIRIKQELTLERQAFDAEMKINNTTDSSEKRGQARIKYKPGNEHWREAEKAEAEGLTQKQFNDRMNDPSKYHYEDPSSNRSHKYEKP